MLFAVWLGGFPGVHTGFGPNEEGTPLTVSLLPASVFARSQAWFLMRLCWVGFLGVPR
jgi:hypothetical protein